MKHDARFLASEILGRFNNKIKLDTLFDTNKSKYVGVFGDVTSTLAAAISTLSLIHI